MPNIQFILDNDIVWLYRNIKINRDKTKGATYTPPPKEWSHRQKYIEIPECATDAEKEMIKKQNERIKFDNSICCDRKTYFFGYVYPKHLVDYNRHKKMYNEYCMNMFGMTLNGLRDIEDKSPEMKKFIRDYYKYQPLFNSKCCMNILARYIEDIQFDSIRKKNLEKFDYKVLMSNKNFMPKKSILKKVSENIFEFNKYYKRIVKTIKTEEENCFNYNDEESSDRFKYLFESFETEMNNICSNTECLVDYIIYSYYNSYPTYSKVMLWNIYGEQLFQNIKKNASSYYKLVEDKCGVEYFGKSYSLQEVSIND